MPLSGPPGYVPTRAQDLTPKSYVDSKVASGGGSGSGASGVGVPTFVQQAAPSYSGGPYVWYQTDSNNAVVNVFVDSVGVPAAALPTSGLVNRWSATAVDTSFTAGQGVFSLNPSAGDIVLQEASTPPSYVKSGLNGKPGLDFNGSNQKLSYSSGTTYNVAQPYTLVAVATLRNLTDTQQLMNMNGAELAITGPQYSTYSGNSIQGGSTTAASHLIIVGADSGGAGAINVDGTQVASGNIGTNSMASVRLGAHPNGIWFLNGVMYETMAYNKNLLNAANATDLSNLKAWARQQFGLTIA